MADTLLFRGGSTADVNASTVQSRELVIDTDTDQIVSGPSKLRTVMAQTNGYIDNAHFSGNVGIGTTNPSIKLEVARLGSAWTGAAPAGGSALFIHNGNNGDTAPANLQFGAGKASVSSIYFGDSDDADAGAIVYRHVDDSLSFNVNTGERMRIASNGNVGIGTTYPTAKLHIKSDTPLFTIEDANGASANLAQTVLLRDNDSYQNQVRSNTGVFTATSYRCDYAANGASAHLFFTQNTQERLRIDSSGRLLVGTSSTRLLGLGISPAVQVEGVNNVSAGSLALTENRSLDDLGSRLVLTKTRGSALGATTIVQNGDEFGSIYFCGADGTNADIRGALIQALVDGTPGANNMPGRLVFSTTADGASSPAERMRIKSDGTINYSNVAVYADNTAALAGGLVAGDVYRKADGTLMITF